MRSRDRVGLLIFISLGFSLKGWSQVVQPSGGAVTSLSWQSPVWGASSFTESSSLDLNADGTPDLRFTNNVFVPPGGSSATTRTFTVAAMQSSVEVACDSVEFDSAKRYQAGQTIRRGASWQPSGYVDYVVQGNGGTGGRGFFRDGVAGAVVARLQVAGQWQYWWVQVEPRYAAQGTQYRRLVSFGQSPAPLLATAGSRNTLAATIYPNPASSAWSVRVPGGSAYQLLDNLGRVVGTGKISESTETMVPAASLPAGVYYLELRNGAGQPTRLRLLRQ
ncbi:T9SS type A sorting domain-containing protein [Hymenobacter sp. BT175]|uniref:T9SS type A sorting domain-containing protein n=1 Tax=Hymenobacter translucens TaxID=2886507 RepID=UPI001D0DDE5A|nr:T9SS type A sorting domain-containing protein [Hymenobacter translucens]MCC2548259.1 T9SS type A sorting domain-containing protein [Hymenobacter translucens]